MLPGRVSLQCSTRARWQSLPPASDIGPRRFSEPKTCLSNLRSPLEWHQATRKARPFLVRIGTFSEAGLTHDARRQLRNVGKVIRKVIQEVVDKSSHRVEDRLTLLRSGSWDQGEDVCSEIVKYPLKARPRRFFLR